MYIPLLAVILVAGAAEAAAQTLHGFPTGKAGPTVVLSNPLAPEAPGPYSELFSGSVKARPGAGQWRILPEPGRSQAPTRGPRAKVVCGMTLLLVGPDVDPKMAKPPAADGTRYTMRRYPAPACRDK